MDKQFQKVLKQFDADLKTKIQNKCPPTQDESTFLARCFKFFDFQNKGSVNFDQFFRSVEKIGVVMDQSDLKLVFDYYDRSGDGLIDYKEFSAIFNAGNNQASQEVYKPINQSTEQYVASKPKAKSNQQEGQELMALFRDKIKARGPRGIIGLQRIFNIMDDDKSQSLSEAEFAKACRDFKIGISPENIPILFNLFDSNHDGTLSIQEFLEAVRGPISPMRADLIKKAFQKVDKDGNGYLDLAEIKAAYHADQHPDVLQGKKTEDSVICEFLETIETHHNLMYNKQNDGMVSEEEFFDYYANVSSSISSDQEFALVMKNTWELRDNKYRSYLNGGQEQQQQAPVKKDPPISRHPEQTLLRSGMMSNDNPLAINTQAYGHPKSASRGNTTAQVMHSGIPVVANPDKVKRPESQFPAAEKVAQKNSNNMLIAGPVQMPKYQALLVERFRNKLKSRGGRGLVGLQRQFKIMDDNGSGALDQYEFTKAIHDFGVDIEQKDIATLFKAFDFSGDGEIDFNEFLRIVVGPMNEFRTKIVKKAFQIIDYSGDGVLDLEDIKGRYNGKMHPDVKSGKRTEDEILTEFLETFEQHHNMMTGEKADGKVTLSEFIEYYTNVSASIDNDAYFDLMMSNAWNMESANNPNSMAYAGSKSKVTVVNSRDAYRRDHHRNLFGTDKQAVFQKGNQGEWKTSTNGAFNEANARPSNAPGAGAATRGYEGNPKMQFMTTTQRTSSVDYQGIKHSDDDLVKLFKDKLASRGARGMLGMQRIFKIMDDNGSNTLDIQEFWKAICDFRVPVSPEECRKLFDLFDMNGDGEIDFGELMRNVVGEMNQTRKAYVQKAFKKIDRDGNGVLNIDDIKGVYNAKMHPDVKSGKKTEQEILSEFLDTFELHYAMNHPESKDRQITLQEFVEYYNNISCTIDRDDYFELMITNAWNLNDKHYSKGWGGEV